MKWLISGIGVMIVLAICLSVYLQPNNLALCPYNNGEPTSRQGCHAAEMIVVVSGGDTPARTEKAVELYKNGWAPKILFSGAAEDKNGPSNAEVMRDHAIQHGVPQSKIIIEQQAENTTENAKEVAGLLRQYNIHDVILVTSGYHQRRASLEFQVATKNDQVVIRNAPTYDGSWHWYWWVTPTGWWLALGEFGRIIIFYMGGGAAI